MTAEKQSELRGEVSEATAQLNQEKKNAKLAAKAVKNRLAVPETGGGSDEKKGKQARGKAKAKAKAKSASAKAKSRGRSKPAVPEGNKKGEGEEHNTSDVKKRKAAAKSQAG